MKENIIGRMKIKSIILGLVYAFGLWVVLPYGFVVLNDYFGLPIMVDTKLQVFGWLLVAFGGSIVVTSVGLFKSIGMGTPVPTDPPEKLVIVGWYRHTRNPMYISHLIIFLGMFFLTGKITLILYLVVAGLGLHLLVTKWEEPQLRKRFGAKYKRYMKKVPRWV